MKKKKWSSEGGELWRHFLSFIHSFRWPKDIKYLPFHLHLATKRKISWCRSRRNWWRASISLPPCESSTIEFIIPSVSQSINNVVGKKTRSPPKRCKGVVLTSNCAASTCSDIIYCNNFLSSGPTDRAQQILGDNAFKWTRPVTTDATRRQGNQKASFSNNTDKLGLSPMNVERIHRFTMVQVEAEGGTMSCVKTWPRLKLQLFSDMNNFTFDDPMLLCYLLRMESAILCVVIWGHSYDRNRN